MIPWHPYSRYSLEWFSRHRAIWIDPGVVKAPGADSWNKFEKQSFWGECHPGECGPFAAARSIDALSEVGEHLLGGAPLIIGSHR